MFCCPIAAIFRNCCLPAIDEETENLNNIDAANIDATGNIDLPNTNSSIVEIV